MKNETNDIRFCGFNKIARLEEILQQLEELGYEASEIIHEISPSCASRGEAYGAFDLGTSTNPHDTTLRSIVETIIDEEC